MTLSNSKLNTFVIPLSLYGANENFLIPVCWIAVSGRKDATLSLKQSRMAMAAQPEHVVKLLPLPLGWFVCHRPEHVVKLFGVNAEESMRWVQQ